MRVAALLLLVSLTLILHTAVLPAAVSGQTVRPDLLLLIVLSWGLALGAGQGAAAALAAGVAADALSALPPGAHLLALVPAVPLIALWTAEQWHRSVPRVMLLTLLAAAGYYLVLSLMVQLSVGSEDWLGMATGVTAPSIAADVVLSPLVLWTAAGIRHVASGGSRVFEPGP